MNIMKWNTIKPSRILYVVMFSDFPTEFPLRSNHFYKRGCIYIGNFHFHLHLIVHSNIITLALPSIQKSNNLFFIFIFSKCSKLPLRLKFTGLGYSSLLYPKLYFTVSNSLFRINGQKLKISLIILPKGIHTNTAVFIS
jgi:hypothetical protein